ncbi:hypothetical protein [Planctobacterium marinum]|uniref:Phytanoyl-CoA dioxygenase n=1 Tax=Planctobacterium marinum TaxID=1631968 RepID=A0AA48HJ91_9ALTE|nr:hypothetical protein MACH26_34190 [Planctobacterium marinum]
MESKKSTQSDTIETHISQLLNLPDSDPDGKKHIDAMASILTEITGISSDFDMNAWQDANLDTGIAISPVQAAKCTDQVIRTKRFIQGVKSCLDKKLAIKSDVNVLYAGTGPYGMLLLPLLTLYQKRPINVTLIDVHSENTQAIKKLIEALDLEEFTEGIHHVDATTWQPDGSIQFDIIISETMNTLLEREPQVSIFSHLVQFLYDDGDLIPEQVLLGARLKAYEIYNEPFIDLGNFFTLNKLSCQKLSDGDKTPLSGSIELPERFSAMAYQMVQMTTDIQVYENIWLHENDCSLNNVKSYKRLKLKPGGQIKFTYHIDKVPLFEFEFPTGSVTFDDTKVPDSANTTIKQLNRFWQATRQLNEGNKDNTFAATNYQTFRAFHDKFDVDYGASLGFILQYQPDFSEFVSWFDGQCAQ